jgi:hypothetical protein
MAKEFLKPAKRLQRPPKPWPAGGGRPWKGKLLPSLRSRIVQAREDGLSWPAIQESVTENGRKIALSTLQFTGKKVLLGRARSPGGEAAGQKQ